MFNIKKIKSSDWIKHTPEMLKMAKLIIKHKTCIANIVNCDQCPCSHKLRTDNRLLCGANKYFRKTSVYSNKGYEENKRDFLKKYIKLFGIKTKLKLLK